MAFLGVGLEVQLDYYDDDFAYKYPQRSRGANAVHQPLPLA